MNKIKQLLTMATFIGLASAQAETISNGVITFSSNETIGRYSVASSINKIIIQSGVTVKGSFNIESRSGNLTIEGAGNDSILEGNGGRYHGIESSSRFTLYMKNFTSFNPGKFHMRLINTKIIADGVRLIDDTVDTGGNHDGFSGAGGSKFNNCYVDTWDDSFKIYYGDYEVSNTTIVHNRNGAPFQMGWGDGTANTCNLTLNNVKVISNAGSYNQGVFSWVGDNERNTRNVIVKGKGFFRAKNSGRDPFGKTIQVASLYQFGNNGGSAYNKTMNFYIQTAQYNTFKDGKRVDRNQSSGNKVNLINQYDGGNDDGGDDGGVSDGYCFLDHKAGRRLRYRSTPNDFVMVNESGDWVKWEIIPVDSTWFYLQHVPTGRRLGSSDGKKIVSMYGSTTGTSAQWKVQEEGTWDRLVHRGSGKRLHVLPNGSRLELVPNNWKGDNTRWKVTNL